MLCASRLFCCSSSTLNSSQNLKLLFLILLLLALEKGGAGSFFFSFYLPAFCFSTPEPPSALTRAAVAGRQRGRSGDTAVPAGPGQRPAVRGIRARVPGPRAARPAARVLTLRFIKEKEDERGGRERRGAPAAFPGFQGSLEPLNEIIGRNGVWRERL